MSSFLRLAIQKGMLPALLVAAAFSALAAVPRESQAGPQPPKPAPSKRFEKEIVAYEEADKQSPPPKGAILFVGASNIKRWKSLAQDFPEHQVINRGFGGSEVADSVYYADRIVIPYAPKAILLGAGGNEIDAGKTPEKVLADVKEFVEKVRAKLPEVRIIYLGNHPSPIRWAQAEKQQKANQLVKEYILTGNNLDFIELWGQFLGADGKPRDDLYVSDRLHFNAEGYKIRAAVVRPYLK